jgi:diguanylate cyclase (GGDEF)-like protein
MDSFNPPSASFCLEGNAPCQFLQELQSLRAEINLLREQVRTDALTGLYNFRFFSDTLPLEMERARRSCQALSLILLDVDHFKKFNDTWGHEIGNQALTLVANLITLTIRKLDYACRFGGEEFVILLPNTDLRQAKNVAERLREAIQTTPLVKNGRNFPITASLGVDEFRPDHNETAEAFIKRVDGLLYEAKRDGRNCVKFPDVTADTARSTVTIDEKDLLFHLFDREKGD